jgi:hypothetical protein
MTTYVIIEYAHGILSGGFGDRIVGLCSAVMLAQCLNKQLLIKWDSPSIKDVFDLSVYDFYRINPSIADSNVIVLHTIDNRFKFEKQLSEQPIHVLWQKYNILLRCNQELAFFLYQNPHLVKGQNYINDMLNVYHSIFPRYLKPLKGNALSIEEPYIGIQLRTGDVYMNVGTEQPIKDVNTAVKNIANYVKTNLSMFTTVYLTSDHPQAKQLFQNELPEFRIIDMPTSRVHLERSNTGVDQLKSLVSDVLTLSRANNLIISSYSNYGRMAALMATNTQQILGFETPAFVVHPLDVSSLFTNQPVRKPAAVTIRRAITTLNRKAQIRRPVRLVRNFRGSQKKIKTMHR